jgi:hypothetical protein
MFCLKGPNRTLRRFYETKSDTGFDATPLWDDMTLNRRQLLAGAAGRWVTIACLRRFETLIA